MKRQMVLGMLAMALAGLWACGSWAADKAEPNQPGKQMTVKGVVHVVKDADGKITKVMIHADKGVVYHVRLNAKGKELGEKMSGKTVEAIGTVKTHDKVEWIIVKEFKEVKVEPAKPAPKS